ncbi:MAG: HAD family phosphatase [Pseudomonadota bacterium]
MLVIFDCDGVLVDTEAASSEAIAGFFTRLRAPVSAEECRKLFQGMPMEDICRQMTERAGIANDPSLPKQVRSCVEHALADVSAPIPGVADLLEVLKTKGIPVCVGSSGSVRKMRMTLGNANLLSHFGDRLFSGQDVSRGKPAPDVFLAAAAAMGIACEEAVIIEDSVVGVRAGVASGARVLGYAGDPHVDADALAAAGAEVFYRMEEVPGLI